MQMIISKKELLDLYKKCFNEQSAASEINKGVTDNLNGYAEHNELNPKAVKAGYQAYKKYLKGTINPNDDDFMEISTIVEDEFGE